MRRPHTAKPAAREKGGARDSFQAAFEKIGGAEALAAWALDKPTEFFRLFARLIPLTGEGAGSDPMEVEIVRFSDPDAEDPAA
jgi:hypothetical protein